MTSYSKSVTKKLKNLQESLLSKLDIFAHGYSTKSIQENSMSYSPMAAQNATMNTAASLGMPGNAVQGVSLSSTGVTSSSTISTNAYANPFLNKDQHIFDCQKVENGWTFAYRGKTRIASTVDEMMEQMKAAMVVERIEK